MDIHSSYADAVRRNHDRVAAVPADRFAAPTPCTEWDVQALIGHIVGGYQMFTTSLGHTVPSIDANTDLAEQHRIAGEAAIAAFADQDALRRTVTIPVGAVPGQVALGLALIDAVVHGWDLATATGQDTTIDEGLAVMLLANAEQSVTANLRQPDGALPVFAPAVTINTHRPADDRLIAFLGRQP